MMLPETTSSARVARAFRRFARGALVGLALGALAGCGGGTSTSTKTARTPEMTGTPEMTITPAVTVKPEYRQQGQPGVDVEDDDLRPDGSWRSLPLGTYFNFPDGTQLRFTVGPRTTGATATGATAEIRDSRLEVGAGFPPGYVVEVVATSAVDPANRASLTFRFPVGSEEEMGGEEERGSNSAPTIAKPEDKTYDRGDAIAPFDVAVSDADRDTVTVSVSGLPGGLTYSQATGRVSGTVAADAAARDHTVTVTADDGVNDPVTATFTIRVWKLVEQTLAVAADNARRVQGPYSSEIGKPPVNNVGQARTVARREYNDHPPAVFDPNPPNSKTTAEIAAHWTSLAVPLATAYCAARQPPGPNVPDNDPAYAYRANTAATVSSAEDWAYSSNQNTYPGTLQFYARKTRTWTATCERTVRRLDE